MNRAPALSLGTVEVMGHIPVGRHGRPQRRVLLAIGTREPNSGEDGGQTQPHGLRWRHRELRQCCWPQGSGRYSIYIANYASGKVGPHALLEMDVAASDPARGIVVLVDVAAQAGVSKYTGMERT